MSDNVIKFPRIKTPVEVAPREIVAYLPFYSRNGEVKEFTVPVSDMYWWAAIYEKIAASNPFFEGVFYFYSQPYGWQNASYDKREKSLEMLIDRKTLKAILESVQYTHVMSLAGQLNDEDYDLVHDNAQMVIGDDLDIEYTLGIFIAPTNDPNRFVLNYVECKND